MRIPALVLIGVAATVCLSSAFLSLASPQEKGNAPHKEIEASTKKVRELQKERIATLAAVVDNAFRLAQAGRVEISDLSKERMSLLKAEVDIAEKESDRIALYRKALETLKEYHALATARFQSARATELHIFQIKARILEVEILLEQSQI
jgi:outer membrane protein TolC